MPKWYDFVFRATTDRCGGFKLEGVFLATATGSTEEIENEVKRGFRGVRVVALNAILVVLAAIISFVFLQAVRQTNDTYEELERASDSYILCESAASEMKEGSNYLTTQVRSFVVTQQLEYLENYFWEADENRRRQRAVETLEDLHDGESVHLERALADSVALMDIEYYAMKLVLEAGGLEASGSASLLDDIELTSEDAALSSQEKIDRATEIVFGDEYVDYVARIEHDVMNCKDALVDEINGIKDQGSSTLHTLLRRQQVLTVLLFAVFVAMIVINAAFVMWPLRVYSSRIQEGRSLPDMGARELRHLSDAYNVMYEENLKNRDVLRRRAEHDHLTGLYNRSVFEQLIEAYAGESYALLVIDVDCFKEINDSFGHDVGDAVLQKLSGLLSRTFRATDYPCRIGGDEFVVFMTEMTEDLKRVVDDKVKVVADGMKDASDGLPSATLSVGVAFSDGTVPGELVFKNADQALYKVKEAGRNGYAFHGIE